MIHFPGRILILGFGGVARCTLPLVLKHIDTAPDRITVMDMADWGDSAVDYIALGIQFRRERLEQDRFADQLASLVGPGDLILDLAWNIGCTDMLTWCHENGVLYLNTSTELWDPYEGHEFKHPTERTLYVRHMAIRNIVQGWKDQGPTAIIEHGANPGLVSHFTKMGLLDIGHQLLSDHPDHPRRDTIERAMASDDFPHLAEALDVRVIHISEIDTQVTSRPHDPNIFRNTWSVEGLFEEGIAPAEIGWGTHERTLPANGHMHAFGPKNQICLSHFGMNTYVKSRVPSGEIRGMVIRHGEAFTISDVLTVRDESGAARYRPSVHYAYQLCPEALKSLEDVRRNHYEHPKTWNIMSDDIVSGRDELGVLLMGHAYRSWWTGSILDIEETRQLVPHQNATTLQVAGSIIGAVTWMIAHPHEGVHIPDDLPHREILGVAKPYLGTIISQPIDWTPTGNPETEDWQFQNFLLTE